MYLANRAPELFPDAGLAVAHCNFGLRGPESDGDEEFVRDWCASHGLECFVRKFDTRAYASDNGISIEMAARELRYDWFGQLIAENGFDRVAVAHNANDNAETLFLNLLRGTGSRGLRGMSEDNGQVLRPLLGIEREEILAWMTGHGLSWREDSTNSENEYKRNRIRNEVFPIFKEMNPSFVRTLGRNMAHFAQADDIVEDIFRQTAAKVLDKDGVVNIPALLESKYWKYVLWRILEPCGLNAETLDKLYALLERFKSSPSGTVTISGKTFQSSTHTVTIEKKTLSFLPQAK